MAAEEVEIDQKRDRLVIVASTLGTVFEWYDFFVYGTLFGIAAGLTVIWYTAQFQALYFLQSAAGLEAGLAEAGYKLDKITPSTGNAIKIVLCIMVIGFLSGMTYRPVAALLVELFPARAAIPRCRCPIISARDISADSCPSPASISWRGPAIPSRASGIRSAS